MKSCSFYDQIADTNAEGVKTIYVEDGENPTKMPIRFHLAKPKGADGQTRDQTNDAAEHMKYAATLKLPQLKCSPHPRMGHAIIVGGGPSIADHFDTIRQFADNPDNAVFAVNWSHTWLIQRGIIPYGCVLFEIDAEPDTVLKAAHPGVRYFICSHCHNKTFDMLADCRRILWHSPPNSDAEKAVGEELFPGSNMVGGGIGTFTRTLTVALHLGFRNIELFGCDSSFPDNAKSTHVDGYETENVIETDSFWVYAKHDNKEEIKRFKTVGYLALQVEEFKEYCRVNHHIYALRVHGDSLLRYVHKLIYPSQYESEY